MLPLIMTAINLAQKKAQNENAQNQQLAQGLQNAVQMPQTPSINSVFGNY